MKIAINECYGGWGLSEEAQNMLGDYDKKLGYWNTSYRNDEALIKVIEELGHGADTENSNLTIVEIPDNATDFMILSDDGCEYVYYVVDGKIYMR